MAVSTRKKVFVILGSLIVIVFIALVLILVQVPYTGYVTYTEKEPYTDTEYYYEKEPYITTECDEKNALYKVDYTTTSSNCIQQECASYTSYCAEKNFWGNCIRYEQSCSSYKCVKYSKNCGIKIDNKERESVNFKIELYKYDYDSEKETLIKTDDVWVSALDTRDVYWDFTYLPTDSIGCWYKFSNTPLISECGEVTRYKDVQKSREVTKYEEVEKTKEVTRYCNAWKKIAGRC